MSTEKTLMFTPADAVVSQLGMHSSESVAPYYEGGEWKRDGISPEMLAADCLTMFSAIDRMSKLITHSHFRSLHKYEDRWGIAHKSWDGVSVGEIIDSDFMRLLDAWEKIADSLVTEECT